MINLNWLAKQSVIHQSVTGEANSSGLLLKARLHNETLAGRVRYLRIIKDVSLTKTPQIVILRSHCQKKKEVIAFCVSKETAPFDRELRLVILGVADEITTLYLTSFLHLDSAWRPWLWKDRKSSNIGIAYVSSFLTEKHLFLRTSLSVHVYVVKDDSFHQWSNELRDTSDSEREQKSKKISGVKMRQTSQTLGF